MNNFRSQIARSILNRLRVGHDLDRSYLQFGRESKQRYLLSKLFVGTFTASTLAAQALTPVGTVEAAFHFDGATESSEQGAALMPLAEAEKQVEEQFQSVVLPIVKKYCVDCHSGDDPAAKLDVEDFEKTASVVQRWHTWQAMLSRTQEGEMPPADYGDQPTAEEIKQLESWTQFFRDTEANKNAGDPGPNSTRRLNNSEYNYSIRELTGVDINPTSSFPIDAANSAGFDNSGESLTLSPALITKYLDAAKQVSEHMILTPKGIEFSPFAVVTDTDRDKYSVQRIVDFYRSKPTRIENYLFASWEVAKRVQEGRDLESSFSEVAGALKVSEKYLRTVYAFLTDEKLEYGPGKKVQNSWKSLVLTESDPQTALFESGAIARELATARRELRAQVQVMRGPNGMGVGSQPVILKKNAIVAANRRNVADVALDPTSDKCRLTDEERAIMVDGDASTRDKIRADYANFCSVFPDAFMIIERGRAYLSEEEAAKEARGRLLSAGFHSMTGFFRDDKPLCELILSDSEKEQLDELWEHFFFSSDVHHRHFAGFLWYERAESTFINEPAFDFIRAEDKDATSHEKLERLRSVYKEKVSRGQENATPVLNAIDEYFDATKANLSVYEQQFEQSKSKHLAALIDFAARAFRKPLSVDDEQRIRDFYQTSLQLPLATHRTAVEDTLVSILMSPEYLYRWDLQAPIVSVESTDESLADQTTSTIKNSTDVAADNKLALESNIPGPGRAALNSHELASRLSYFLWCSLPDEELTRLANANSLTQPDAILAQTKRMLLDEKSNSMLLEFMGNWLEFRRFENHNAVDREQFPAFTDELRASMAQEPLQLLRHIVETDGKITDLILANHVIVDEHLAKFYGIDEYKHDSEKKWQLIKDAERFGRGGLLPMGLFLTQNSPGLRTSPVKRGYWVIRKLLGEHIPPPPPDVPELPSSETQLGDLTVREALAKHREHVSCAACHKRFDFAGVLLEAFDPIGKPRTVDLGGRSISTRVELPSGIEVEGVDGLKRYIVEERLDDFRRHFCESLAAFALNRSLIIPDTLLVDSMMEAMKQNNDSFTAAVKCLVTSPQFLQKRVVQVNTAVKAQ